MIRVAVVEDDELYTQQIIGYLKQYEEENGTGFDIACFTDGDGIVRHYKPAYDLILMDIQMPFLDGMTATEEIRKLDSRVIIMFITNMTDYALRGYTVDAFDYVIKPISYFSFSERISRAIRRLNSRPQKPVTLQIRGGIARVDMADITYIESQGHTMIYHTVSGDYAGTDQMNKIEERLSGEGFFRGNKGYLINLAHVESVQDGVVIVRGTRLALSRGRRHAFMDARMEYWAQAT